MITNKLYHRLRKFARGNIDFIEDFSLGHAEYPPPKWQSRAKLSESERSRLDAVANLAPGDFRTVRQSLYYLGSGVDNAMRIGELEKESGVKSATKRHRIGF